MSIPLRTMLLLLAVTFGFACGDEEAPGAEAPASAESSGDEGAASPPSVDDVIEPGRQTGGSTPMEADEAQEDPGAEDEAAEEGDDEGYEDDEE
ncbi:MAG: hypothetical protein OEZ06_13000 [Myxococcales bacterium]|nr:hypothetical protein [Myxococcales bacterium]